MNQPEFERRVQELKEAGAKVIAPNGLPIKCIRHDGVLLETEHGDHPDYKFPVTAKYKGDKQDVTEVDDDGAVLYVADTETHALIFTDGTRTITLHECCYFVWDRDGGLLFGGDWARRSWQLTGDSLAKIQGLAASKRAAAQDPPPRSDSRTVVYTADNADQMSDVCESIADELSEISVRSRIVLTIEQKGGSDG